MTTMIVVLEEKMALKLSEDWLAVVIGFVIVLIAAAGIVSAKMIPWKLV